MTNLFPSDAALLAPIEQAHMIARTLAWAKVNSGSRNLSGLAVMAGLLVDAFAVLPGQVALVDPEPVEAINANGERDAVFSGLHLVPQVRPEARTLVAETTAAVAAEHDVAAQVHGASVDPLSVSIVRPKALFGLVTGAAADLGETLIWRDSGGVCDGNNIAACGVPVIDTMGANGDHIHSPEEYLDVRSLVSKAQLTALVLKRLEQKGDLQ